jgi:hypothetical protein
MPQVLTNNEDDDGIDIDDEIALGGANKERIVARGSLDFINVSPTKQQLTPRL